MPEDLGQSQVQERKDKEEALGYVPSEGFSLGAEEDASPEQLAEEQKAANKQFQMPPYGDAAEPMPAPHRGGTAGVEETEGADTGAPAKSASREEWDAYAESQGVDPSEFSNKDDLIAHFDQS